MATTLYAPTHASSVAKARAFWAEGKHLEAGRLLFEAVPRQDQPRWAVVLLERACAEFKPPDCVAEVLRIAQDADRWHEGHRAFRDVRVILLAQERRGLENDQLSILLSLAELVAKVTYNASGRPAPFDPDSGWYLPECLLHFLREIAMHAPEHEVEQFLFGTKDA
jgi:hypothetical protein